jgi:hypothetical protein
VEKIRGPKATRDRRDLQVLRAHKGYKEWLARRANQGLKVRKARKAPLARRERRAKKEKKGTRVIKAMPGEVIRESGGRKVKREILVQLVLSRWMGRRAARRTRFWPQYSVLLVVRPTVLNALHRQQSLSV